MSKKMDQLNASEAWLLGMRAAKYIGMTRDDQLFLNPVLEAIIGIYLEQKKQDPKQAYRSLLQDRP